VSVSGLNADNMLKSSAYIPWFKGWKISHKDGSASGSTCLKLWISSYHQLVQLTCLCICPSKMSIKFMVLVPSWAEWKLVFLIPAWWTPLLQSTSQWK
jgi:hypothetical protein